MSRRSVIKRAKINRNRQLAEKKAAEAKRSLKFIYEGSNCHNTINIARCLNCETGYDGTSTYNPGEYFGTHNVDAAAESAYWDLMPHARKTASINNGVEMVQLLGPKVRVMYYDTPTGWWYYAPETKVKKVIRYGFRFNDTHRMIRYVSLEGCFASVGCDFMELEKILQGLSTWSDTPEEKRQHTAERGRIICGVLRGLQRIATTDEVIGKCLANDIAKYAKVKILFDKYGITV